MAVFCPAAADAKKYGFSLPLSILFGSLRVIVLWLLIASIIRVIALGLWVYGKWIRRKPTQFKHCLADGFDIFITMSFAIFILGAVTGWIVGILSAMGILNLEG
ncbi:hypothetical protein GC197_18035 [bacterium]|nr:hypothetical protein [bacterium]